MENQTNITKVVAPEIVCGGCAAAIENALGKIGGVSRVAVDVDAKTVSVEHNTEVSREKIVEALDEAGFSTD